MRWLVDVAYPNAPVVRVVLDNLNTHRMASLYEAFPAAEARRIVKRLEFHHTSKHASWLNPVLSLPKGWRRLSLACLPELVSREEIPTMMLWNEESAPMRQSVTRYKPPSTGASASRTPEPNSIASIPSIPNLTEY